MKTDSGQTIDNRTLTLATSPGCHNQSVCSRVSRTGRAWSVTTSSQCLDPLPTGTSQRKWTITPTSTKMLRSSVPGPPAIRAHLNHPPPLFFSPSSVAPSLPALRTGQAHAQGAHLAAQALKRLSVGLSWGWYVLMSSP